MPLINCKVELKLEWLNHCALSGNGNDNTDADPNDVIFTIKNTKLYVPCSLIVSKRQPKTIKTS